MLTKKKYIFVVCGGEIITPGEIKSSTIVDEQTGKIGYPRNENCTWTIRAPPNQVVRLVYA